MKKTLIGIMSFAPIVLFAVSMIMLVIGMVMAETSGGDAGLALAITACVVMFICVAVTWVDIVWFIIIACRKDWPTDKKVVWGLLVYFLNMLVFPFFWWNAIVKDNP
ncbi:MAG: hypothetical protein E7292_04655 [Lachnospiraceae bacterium]|nr:hypothetical protein [Lachnospiraceae bacterium]